MQAGSYGSATYGAKKRKYGYVNYLLTLLVRL